jgi:hypothetical protein
LRVPSLGLIDPSVNGDHNGPEPGATTASLAALLSSLRYFLADLGHWLARHKALTAVIAVLVAALGVGAYLLGGSRTNDEQRGPAPSVVVNEVTVPERNEELGFPAFATKNTTRIASPSSVATAPAAALAVFPSTGGVPGPAAVSVVDSLDWPAAIAAASLVAAPVGAPLLVAEDGELGELNESAIRDLGPEGSSATGGRQVFALGAAAGSTDLDELAVEGANPAELAARVLALRARLAGKPEHIVIASSDDPGYSMPAASWAARSGDPVLFVGRETVPAATAKALERYEGTPVYVLGPPSAIASRALKQLRRLAPTVERVGADGVVANAIEFARFASGSFGWNINDPGHGFVIASTARPIDAAAAAPLSAGGTWGPLLLTDDARSVPTSLRNYLLDLKPGYTTDPTRAVYNHVWLIGDPTAISVQFQADVDQLAEVAKVRSGSGSSLLGPAPGTPEHEQGPGSKKQ